MLRPEWESFGIPQVSEKDDRSRPGYGLTYSTTLMWNQMHNVLNPPYGTTVSFVPAPVNVSSSSPLGGGGVANPWYNQPGGNQFPSPEPPPSNYLFQQSGAYVFQNTNNQPAHTQSWNISFQDQITANWLFSATYIGNKSNDQWLGEDLNQAIVVSAGMTAPGIVSTTGNDRDFGSPVHCCTVLRPWRSPHAMPRQPPR